MIRLGLLFLMCLFLASHAEGQSRIASVGAQGKVNTRITEEELQLPTFRRSGAMLHAGFPLVVPADPSFKNFRNVTLHDLDGDGADEIIFGSANRLYCFRNDELLWSAQLFGNSRFPAAIGDLDADGEYEIIVTTGFSDEDGMVYVFDKNGGPVAPWPKAFGGHWKLSSPSVADVDGDGDLEIAFGDLQGSLGSVHLVHHDGTMYSNAWPVDLPNIPAVTPSFGDLDGDGRSEIIICTTREIYALDVDGQILAGWPIASTGTKYSFQSPVIADITSDGGLEIMGTGHGDNPHYYAYDASGDALNKWPISIPEASWSFHPPTVFSHEGVLSIINAKPGTGAAGDMLFARGPDGALRPGYPLRQQGGHEGVTTVADVDGDGDPDLVFSSNLITTDGEGLIYAYDFLSGALLEGYPLVQKGWTYMNGAAFGDINGDEKLDMVVLTYTENEGGIPDTTFVYAYDLQVPDEHVWWSTYKGSNDRSGLIALDPLASSVIEIESLIKVFPNPSDGLIHFNLPEFMLRPEVQLFDVSGRSIYKFQAFKSSQEIHLPFPGVYFLHISDGTQYIVEKVISH